MNYTLLFLRCVTTLFLSFATYESDYSYMIAVACANTMIFSIIVFVLIANVKTTWSRIVSMVLTFFIVGILVLTCVGVYNSVIPYTITSDIITITLLWCIEDEILERLILSSPIIFIYLSVMCLTLLIVA